MELWAFLKSKGKATTGGMAKVIIREGRVRINGQVVTQKKKKLNPDDIVTLDGQILS